MYLDSANEKEINEALNLGIIKGITTNPTLLLKEKEARFKQIEMLLTKESKQIFVQVLGDTSDDMTRDGLLVLEHFKGSEITLKIPITIEGLKAIKNIRQVNTDVKILGTAIYSSNQAIAAGLAGADFVAPYVNRMLNNSIDAFLEINKMKNYFEEHAISCQIMGASFKNANQVSEAFASGADTVTVPLDILKQFVTNDLAIQAVEVFNEHGKELDKLNGTGND